MKAADITDEAFLAAIDEARRIRSALDSYDWLTVARWDVAAVLAGHPEHVGTATDRNYPHMPPKVVLAKARKLINRKLMDGCPCGCRGDFERIPT